VVLAREVLVVLVRTPVVSVLTRVLEALRNWALVVVAFVVEALMVAMFPVVPQRVWIVATEAARLVNDAVRAVRIEEKKLVVVACVILARVAKRSVVVADEMVALVRSMPVRLRVWILAVVILAVVIDDED
jgi:hypothetical protein